MFEPSAGNRIFSEMAAAEPGLTVLRNARVEQVKRRGERWLISVRTTGGMIRYSSAILIDATELGDISKMCGVKYDLGMDSRYDTGEDIAPERANNIVQDLTYVAVLKDYGREVPMSGPEGYDPSLFACSCINPVCPGEEMRGEMVMRSDAELRKASEQQVHDKLAAVRERLLCQSDRDGLQRGGRKP